VLLPFLHYLSDNLLYKSGCLFYSLQGVAKPRGGHNDPLKHQIGDTASEFTSWTTSHRQARQFATQGGADGIVITTKIPKSRTTTGPLNLGEDEVLVKGVVTGAKQTF
jgi:hypothetical protein